MIAVPSKTLELPSTKPTWAGYLLLLLGLSLFLSAFKNLRPELGGLSVHPYLIVLAIAAPFALLARKPFPVRRSLDGFGVAFLVGVFLSFLGNNELMSGLPFLVKWATMAVTFVVANRLVRTEGDVRLGVVGLIIGVTAIAVRGVILHQIDPRYYLDLMPGVGSRNVFSLWSIAPVAFCMWMFGAPSVSRPFKIFLALTLLMMAVPQILSLSRSGWMLVATTFVLVLAMRRSLSSLVAVVLVIVTLQIGVSQLEFESKLEERLIDLEEGTQSDEARRDAIMAGLIIFVRNPLLGVSQSRLPREIGHELDEKIIASHNLAIDLLGGTGLAGTIPLLLCGFVLLRRWNGAMTSGVGPAKEYAAALPILMLLTLERGMSSDEILYNPSVILGIALAFGAANVSIGRGREREEQWDATS